ncbi:hypothetical protein [Defluviimonas sp. WL0075]|uniref:Uncharacterized protein n=1 Tax=Albidovulum sediminicola TaxID=2984331 RepID=A0ABT2Z2U9_9RHOB|nr:hypothetical protein [Defluviimonas sp. WL0075]MCV2865436.1 hypothetical protein [Defluviimonas sp. WL0075]
MLAAFETTSVAMVKAVQIEVQAPEADARRILAAVAAIDPLAMTPAYDNNALLTGPGIERYRPRQGAVAGVEEEVRERPGVVRVIFELTSGQDTLAEVIETIFQAHCYQEPVIRLSEILTARSKGRDDRDNPNRWWNTTGDWKRGS